MIISTSRWGVWAVWLGSLGTALGHSSGWHSDQAYHGKPTTTYNMARTSDGVFTSSWPEFPPSISLGKYYSFNYTFDVKMLPEFTDKRAGLILCYATNYLNGLSPSNVWDVMLTSVDCE
jgi:hypothetical protein